MSELEKIPESIKALGVGLGALTGVYLVWRYLIPWLEKVTRPPPPPHEIEYDPHRREIRIRRLTLSVGWEKHFTPWEHEAWMTREISCETLAEAIRSVDPRAAEALEKGAKSVIGYQVDFVGRVIGPVRVDLYTWVDGAGRVGFRWFGPGRFRQTSPAPRLRWCIGIDLHAYAKLAQPYFPPAGVAIDEVVLRDWVIRL